MLRSLRNLTGLGILLVLFPAAAQEPVPAPAPPPDTGLERPAPAAAGPALSPRNASYTIWVRLDPEARTLDASQAATWTNIQNAPARELRFHFYWNAWRNDRSTWMLEERLSGDYPKRIREDAWGWIDVEAIRLVGADGAALDLTAAARFAAPDDGNPDDRTVMVVPLPQPVPPGGTVRVELDWRAKVPRTFARTGYRGDFFFIAHWFPKLGVFDGAAGWSCHQFHSNTEFYSDYGVYDVTIETPEGFVVGATGKQVEERPVATAGGAGWVAHRFVQEDVHSFTWTASPDFRVAEDRFSLPGLPPVDLTVLYQPEHEHQVARHLAATKAALEHYGLWYGPYPYDHLTVVDPAWESGAGGMEYPTIFTAGTRLFNPFGGGSPEGVTIHEAGHQFWYGVVGNDELEHAWLDEGLNTFSTARVYDEVYGDETWVERYLRPPGTSWRGFLPAVVPGVRIDRAVGGNRLDRYRRHATSDVPATPTWRYYPASHGAISYSKTAVWLATLERHLGWETLRTILSTFYQRYAFRHPLPEDFFAVANEVARSERGIGLDWFFDQVYYDDVVFDYAVERAESSPAAAEGMLEDGNELVYRTGGEPSGPGGEELWRSEVVVRRRGTGVFPVEVVMVFADGSEERRVWNGLERWKLFVVEGPAELHHAAIDPERVLLLDLDYTNNSRLAEPAGHLAAVKWAGKWMIWAQDFLQTMAGYV